MNAIRNNVVTYKKKPTEAGRDFKILEVGMCSTSNQAEWLVRTKISNKDVVLKIDTGVQTNVLPISWRKRVSTNTNFAKKHVNCAQ